MSPRGPPTGIREPKADGAAVPAANWGMYAGIPCRPGGEVWGFPPRTKGVRWRKERTLCLSPEEFGDRWLG
eukprot:9682643-Alexandrium_andersonii.AAC.1